MNGSALFEKVLKDVNPGWFVRVERTYDQDAYKIMMVRSHYADFQIDGVTMMKASQQGESTIISVLEQHARYSKLALADSLEQEAKRLRAEVWG